jgi:hypothetical protein
MAEVLAHLGEVEERRLHLLAGYGSMFAYCVSRLGMSEDEACRRIDVARLARRHPSLFPLLATGQISLSVAALLKPYLWIERGSDERHSNERAVGEVDGLVAAVSGKTVQQAREALAARFPRPDVESSIRKLPERNRDAGSRPATFESVANPRPTVSRAPAPQPETVDTDRGDAGSRPAAQGSWAIAGGVSRSVENVAPAAIALQLDGVSGPAPHVAVLHSPPVDCAAMPMMPSSSPTGSRVRDVAATPEGTSVAPPAPRRFVLEPPRAERLEPLSPGRYRVQFTADVALKEKLELARDLMRHTLPTGDLAAIVARSLDLLIEQLMKRRFGATTRQGNRAHRTQCPDCSPTTAEQPADAQQPANPEQLPNAQQPAAAVESSNSPPSKPAASSVDRATRRAVLERDGLQCTWRGEDGLRCEARGWLEHDHIRPRARGGNSSVSNGRILCRAHNRLAAEQEFSRQHIEEAIAEWRAKRRPLRVSP